MISPASSSTLRCCEIAGCVISNGLASSLTVASPCESRARIARRVGSAKAENFVSRPSISNTLYKVLLIVKVKFTLGCRIAVNPGLSDFGRLKTWRLTLFGPHGWGTRRLLYPLRDGMAKFRIIISSRLLSSDRHRQGSTVFQIGLQYLTKYGSSHEGVLL